MPQAVHNQQAYRTLLTAPSRIVVSRCSADVLPAMQATSCDLQHAAAARTPAQKQTPACTHAGGPVARAAWHRLST